MSRAQERAKHERQNDDYATTKTPQNSASLNDNAHPHSPAFITSRYCLLIAIALASLSAHAGGGKAGNTKVAGPRKSTVKQKTKLAMDPPKQGAFCKESNIREVVQKRANALRNCYEQQLLANPDLSGKIIVFWKIGLDGKVTDASIKSTTMNNARVESCLTQTVRRLRFDKPDGGICVVEFPFIFTSAQ